MRPRTLVARGLRHYWRANVAVVLGVGAAAAALGGSLVVGDSVRGSLARTALDRLGRATHAVESAGFFREALAGDLAAAPAFRESFTAASPILTLTGVATHATTRRRAGDVLVHGVDERYWALQGAAAPDLGDRAAIVSEPLAAELQAGVGDALLLRLHAAAEIPGSSLFGRRDDPAKAIRLDVREVRSRAALGELALRPRSGAVRAVFVPLRTLQRALGLEGRANAVLAVAEGEGTTPALETAVAAAARLEDLGVRVRALPASGALQLETTTALVGDRLAAEATAVAREQGLAVTTTSLVYLANAIRVGDRQVPYSLVAALDEAALSRLGPTTAESPIVLNDWTRDALGARPGDRVILDFYLWRDEGRLDTGSAAFTLAAVTPMTGLAADRDLVPEYPGITESLRLADWEPPFPIDLDRIRPADEAYWERHRATPKAFVSLEDGQRLWGHPQGRLTSLRLVPPAGRDLEAARRAFAGALLARLRPAGGPASGTPNALAVVPVRETALAAARGATDFGEYFTYFSFFLVVASLLLAGLFFRLGIEQRLREVGLLEALGFAPRRIRRLFLAEGLSLAGLGALLGAAAAPGYAALVLWALRALWADALGTADLSPHVRPASPLLGALGAALAAAAAIAWTLRDLRRLSPRRLLAGALEPWTGRPRPRRFALPAVLAAAAVALAAASRRGLVPDAAGFFGAGGLLLLSALLLARQALAGRPREALAVRSVTGLGLRGVSFRPGRSALCVALVAAATFVILAVGSFRHDGVSGLEARDGPTGGYRLLAWSLVPLHHDLARADGREALGLDPHALDGAGVDRFRARRGDDASCLNLYAPGEPTVLGATPAFLRAGRFSFQSSLAATDGERANPWFLLERERDPDGAVPVVADAGSLAYVLHRKLGDVFPIGATGVRVRVVGALRPGLLQSELVTSERHFDSAFPGRTGASFFLLDVPADRADAVSEALESGLSDHGVDVASAEERMRDFHRVENTYIATFQALGALGLLLGVVGLATVLARNALEQRGELGLLRAVGFRASHVTRMVLAENAALVGLGFLAGAVPALVAILPTLLGGRGAVPLALAALLLAALAVTGLLVTWLAVAFIRRLPLLASLRVE
ncbi:MAG TPA: ABC transporter permease [Vicinamibacteria bacterium]